MVVVIAMVVGLMPVLVPKPTVSRRLVQQTCQQLLLRLSMAATKMSHRQGLPVAMQTATMAMVSTLTMQG